MNIPFRADESSASLLRARGLQEQAEFAWLSYWESARPTCERRPPPKPLIVYVSRAIGLTALCEKDAPHLAFLSSKLQSHFGWLEQPALCAVLIAYAMAVRYGCLPEAGLRALAFCVSKDLNDRGIEDMIRTLIPAVGDVGKSVTSTAKEKMDEFDRVLLRQTGISDDPQLLSCAPGYGGCGRYHEVQQPAWRLSTREAWPILGALCLYVDPPGYHDYGLNPRMSIPHIAACPLLESAQAMVFAYAHSDDAVELLTDATRNIAEPESRSQRVMELAQSLLCISTTVASSMRRTRRAPSRTEPALPPYACGSPHSWSEGWYFLPAEVPLSMDVPPAMQEASDLLRPFNSFEHHLFISHRWLHVNHPDPRGDMWRWVRELCWLFNAPERVGIWFDYCCLPQGNKCEGCRHYFLDRISRMNELLCTIPVVGIYDEVLKGESTCRLWCACEISSPLSIVLSCYDTCEFDSQVLASDVLRTLVLIPDGSELFSVSLGDYGARTSSAPWIGAKVWTPVLRELTIEQMMRLLPLECTEEEDVRRCYTLMQERYRGA